MFSKIAAFTAAALLLATVAAPVHAALTSNGGGENGRSTQGLSIQSTAAGPSLFTVDSIELPAAMR